MAHIHFSSPDDEVFISEGRKLLIFSTSRSVLNGGSTSRFFNVAGELSISGLVLNNGRASRGGAVYVSASGSLELYHSTLSYNQAMVKYLNTKKKVGLTWGEGGAIYSEGDLYVEACNFEANDGNGAAVWFGDASSPPRLASFEVFDSSFQANKSPAGGGGAVTNYGNMKVVRSLFQSNVAKQAGGAILSANPAGADFVASLEIHGTAFESNSAGYGEEANDVVVRGGDSKGDLSCSSCETSRLEGGLKNGKCQELNCDGCASIFHQCYHALETGRIWHQEKHWRTTNNVVWW